MRNQLLGLLQRRNLLRIPAQPAPAAVIGECHLPPGGPATSSPAPLPDDHLDMIVTAAARWDAFPSGVSAQDAMTLLLRARTEALPSRPGSISPLPAPGAEQCHHRPVEEVLKPVEVLKAAYAFEHASNSTPGWWQSVARELISRVARAAAERLDGYAAAPRIWTRPPERLAPAFGLSGGWHPESLGLEWVDVHNLNAPFPAAARWGQATLIVVTAAALAAMPADLSYRPGVFVIAQAAPDDATWTRITSLKPEAVLFWPTGADWLLEQLRGRFRTAADPGRSPALSPAVQQ